MHSDERRRQIASLTAVHGRVTVVELAERFGVKPETIRRDLTILDDDGALHRVHGGAVPTNSFQTTELSIEARRHAATEAKVTIGRAAAAFLPGDGGSVFLDAGTTTAMLAHSMSEAAPVHRSIVTNSLPTAVRLTAAGIADVQLLGGEVRPITQAVVGDTALRSIGVMRADVAFVGTNALTMDHGLSTADAKEAALKRAMITNARSVVAMCDSTKFGRDYLVSFAGVGDIDVLVTDSGAPQQYVDALTAAGVEVVVAE